jgi:hypothetical protein
MQLLPRDPQASHISSAARAVHLARPFLGRAGNLRSRSELPSGLPSKSHGLRPALNILSRFKLSITLELFKICLNSSIAIKSLLSQLRLSPTLPHYNNDNKKAEAAIDTRG